MRWAAAFACCWMPIPVEGLRREAPYVAAMAAAAPDLRGYRGRPRDLHLGGVPAGRGDAGAVRHRPRPRRRHPIGEPPGAIGAAEHRARAAWLPTMRACGVRAASDGGRRGEAAAGPRGGGSPRRIELWTAGPRLLELVIAPSTDSAAPVPPPAVAPPSPRVQPPAACGRPGVPMLRQVRPDAAGDSGLTLRRWATSASVQAVDQSARRLRRPERSVAGARQPGERRWWNLSRRPRRRPVMPHRGALVDVAGTPWQVWSVFRTTVLAPARAFLARLTVVAISVAVVAALVVGALTGVTSPLHELDRRRAIAAGRARGASSPIETRSASSVPPSAMTARVRHARRSERRVAQYRRSRGHQRGTEAFSYSVSHDLRARCARRGVAALLENMPAPSSTI